MPSILFHLHLTIPLRDKQYNVIFIYFVEKETESYRVLSNLLRVMSIGQGQESPSGVD